MITARTYTAKYRDGSGIVKEVATGCRDESAARSILGKLERRAEKVKGEVLTAAEDAIVDHQAVPLAEHITAFIDHQKAKGVPAGSMTSRRQFGRVATDCGFRRLTDLTASAWNAGLLARASRRHGAATRNDYRVAWVMFGNWCIRTHRLLSSPFADVPRADAKADRRRHAGH